MTGLSKGYQAAEGAFAVGGGGGQQQPSRRGVWCADVEAFPQAGGGVAAFEGDLADQGVAERVQEQEPLVIRS